ncbi:MAG TPA: hypothetical protein VE776_15780 [Actinomycetota bacterium]|nr:hypothetical protein [Actinomycetota bacterium]
MNQVTARRAARPLRAVPFLAIFALLAAACGGGGQSSGAASGGAQTPATQAPTTTQAAMAMPPGVENMKVAITSPADGTKVTANQVTLKVATTGYTDTCDLAGKPAVNATTGHYHVLLDKSLVNMYCTPTAAVSMQNVKPGKHTLTVMPALNDHAEVEDNATSVTIDYQPTNPLPALTDKPAAGTPSIKILEPQPGATVSGPFDVKVQISNFNANCDLFGKPGVAGYGHWHLNLDSTSGPMQGMGSMVAMSCQHVMHATTQGLKAGETHTLIALLADDGHAPLNPPIEDKVEVKIG